MSDNWPFLNYNKNTFFSIRRKEQDAGGSSSYVEMFYEAHVENGLINGFFAASVYIIVCMTMDRYCAERNSF